MAADLVSIGDSWLSSAIRDRLIEPIKDVEQQDWFKGLSDKWKDWGDLWRPELAGKISMIGSPREVIGAVLKHMGASYNTRDMESQIAGGREGVMHDPVMLQKQSLAAGGFAVGWSSDVIPPAKRMSNVAVIVPKSGASLGADLWATPAASGFASVQIDSRIRGPSPPVRQWLEFCLQTARALPFEEQVILGASPIHLEQSSVEGNNQELRKGRPELETNLIDGVPHPEILSRCEFLEPLSEKALEDYQWLISRMQKPSHDWIRRILRQISLDAWDVQIRPII